MFEPCGDDGIFYKIGSEMILDITQLGRKDWNLLATLYVDYEISGIMNSNGKLVPWVTFCYDNLPYEGGIERQNAFKTDMGVKLDGVISNTIIGMVWNSGNLISDKTDTSMGFIKAFVEIKY